MTNIPVSRSRGGGDHGGAARGDGGKGGVRNAVYLRGTTANQFSFYYRTNTASLQLLDLCSRCLLCSPTFLWPEHVLAVARLQYEIVSTLETCLGYFLWATYVGNVLSRSLKRQVKEKIIRMETARSGTDMRAFILMPMTHARNKIVREWLVGDSYAKI